MQQEMMLPMIHCWDQTDFTQLPLAVFALTVQAAAQALPDVATWIS